jgi:hypothetical protein
MLTPNNAKDGAHRPCSRPQAARLQSEAVDDFQPRDGRVSIAAHRREGRVARITQPQAFDSALWMVAEYKALFPASKLSGLAGWILIKLPAGVDKKSPMFSVWLSENYSKGENGIPAPESIGVIR